MRLTGSLRLETPLPPNLSLATESYQNIPTSKHYEPMSTHARIGIQHPDGTVDSVYCHMDGYPSFTGIQLLKHFGTFDKALRLVNGGDMDVVFDEYLKGPSYWGNSPFLTHCSLDDFAQTWQQYNYLFKEGKWLLVDRVSQDGEVEGVCITLP